MGVVWRQGSLQIYDIQNIYVDNACVSIFGTKTIRPTRRLNEKAFDSIRHTRSLTKQAFGTIAM